MKQKKIYLSASTWNCTEQNLMTKELNRVIINTITSEICKKQAPKEIQPTDFYSYLLYLLFFSLNNFTVSLNLSGSSILLTSLIISAIGLQSQACVSQSCSGSIRSLDRVNITSFHLLVLFTENVKLLIYTHTVTYTHTCTQSSQSNRKLKASALILGDSQASHNSHKVIPSL